MVVFEVGQKLKHNVALLLKVALDHFKFNLEVIILQFLIVQIPQQSTQELAHGEYILKGLENLVEIEEALVSDAIKIVIMK